ncbi:hypothetical protein Tco_1262841 [Tanacetum coccineum]
MRFPDLPSTSIKLMLFPVFPLEVVAKGSSNSSTPGISPDVAALTTEVSELKNLMKTMLIDKQKVQALASIKAVEQSCITFGGPQLLFRYRPVVFNPLKEPEQNPETSMDKVQKPSSENTAQVPPPKDHDSIFIEISKPTAKKTVNIEIQEPNSPKPTSYQPKLPYPERMKLKETRNQCAQHSRLIILLRTKRTSEEIAITTVNAECSAIIMNKVLEKLKDPGKFLIPYALQELDRTSALANSKASINLLPHSIYKQLGLGALTPTRMTLELANLIILSTVSSKSPFEDSGNPGSIKIDISSVPDDLIPLGTDKTKITRKPSKTGKHGHEERKSTKEAGD